MQKLPKFGQRSFDYDASREKECEEKVREFVERGNGVKRMNVCEPDCEWNAFKVTKDKTGIFRQFGNFYDKVLYLSVEEAFFLSNRRVIEVSPCQILENTQVFWQKILLYSYFKRKGIEIDKNQTSLAGMLSKYFGASKKVCKGQTEVEIKNADDPLDLCKSTVYVYADGNFEKICIKAWDTHCPI